MPPSLKNVHRYNSSTFFKKNRGMFNISPLILLKMLLQYLCLSVVYLLLRQICRHYKNSPILVKLRFEHKWQCWNWLLLSSIICSAMTDSYITSVTLSCFSSQMGFSITFFILIYLQEYVPKQSVQITLPYQHF